MVSGCAGTYQGSQYAGGGGYDAIQAMYDRQNDPDSWAMRSEMQRSMNRSVITIGGKAYRVRGGGGAY